MPSFLWPRGWIRRVCALAFELPVYRIGERHELVAGIHAPEVARAAEMAARGFRFISCAADADLVREGSAEDAEVLREATARIMAAITVLLEELRGEKAPAERFDSRKHGLPSTGNPHRKGRRA